MDPLARIAEARIEDALERGALDDVPGRGVPLALEDLSGVPAELRGGYLLLRGAGYLPEEARLRKEALRLGDLLAACADPDERCRLRARREALALRHAVLAERRRERARPPRRR